MKRFKIAVIIILTLMIVVYGFGIYWNMYKVINVPSTSISINPIYPFDNEMGVKDACMVYKDGYYYIYASSFMFVNGRERTHILGVRTQNFSQFEQLVLLSGEEWGYIGICSPDIVLNDGKYYMTYNSWGDKPNEPNRLLYAVSDDLINWEWNKPLAANITEGIRSIDAAIAFFDNKVYLAYKQKQTTCFAYADSIDGEWQFIHKKMKGWYENFQFINVDGEILLVATDRLHNPTILEMRGNPSDIISWGDWVIKNRIIPPQQQFNTNERANAASIADLREIDGYFYMIYAGRTENRTHLGRGDNKLGLIRSKDLINWECM